MFNGPQACIVAMAALAAVTMPAIGQPVQSRLMQVHCGDKETMLEGLRNRFDEEAVFIGVVDRGPPLQTVAIFADPAPEGDHSWTVVGMNGSEACLLAAGFIWKLGELGAVPAPTGDPS